MGKTTHFEIRSRGSSLDSENEPRLEEHALNAFFISLGFPSMFHGQICGRRRRRAATPQRASNARAPGLPNSSRERRHARHHFIFAFNANGTWMAFKHDSRERKCWMVAPHAAVGRSLASHCGHDNWPAPTQRAASSGIGFSVALPDCGAGMTGNAQIHPIVLEMFILRTATLCILQCQTTSNKNKTYRLLCLCAST